MDASATNSKKDDTEPTVTEWETAKDSVVSLTIKGKKPCKGCNKEEAAIKFREKLIIALSALFVLLFAIDVALVVRVTLGCKGGLFSEKNQTVNQTDNQTGNQTDNQTESTTPPVKDCNIVAMDEHAFLLPPAKNYLQLGGKAEYKCKPPYLPLSPNGTVVCDSKKDFNLTCENECSDGNYFESKEESKKVCIFVLRLTINKEYIYNFSYPLTYAVALEACDARGPGWTINMPKTHQEDDWVHKGVRAKITSNARSYVHWIGLRYNVEEKAWMWLDGTKAEWTNWMQKVYPPVKSADSCVTDRNKNFWATETCDWMGVNTLACQREYSP